MNKNFSCFVLALTAVMVSSATPRAQVPAPVEKAAQKAGTLVTDNWIKMKVYTLFVPEKGLDASDIDVDVKNGVVTLNGTVTTSAGRERAVAIVKEADDVKGVIDNLRVAPAGATPLRMSDGFIKGRIYGLLMNDSALEGSDIDVDVNDGVVTLKGTVRSETGRTRAVAIAKSSAGVKSVTDTLTISARR